MKNLIKKIINNFGYDLKKLNSESKILNSDDLLRDKINKDPIIFDIGANKGQSIDRFIKIFNNPTIHSFEPIKSEYELMKKKFNNFENIILNNHAMGEIQDIREFNITAKSANSSFNKHNEDSDWIKVRSKQHKMSTTDYIQEKVNVQINTVDNYVNENKISKIDLLKIDTEGYEDKVLEGSLESLKSNKISAIATEIILDNVYDKYFNFSDIEKYIVPNNFRLVGLDLVNNNLFSGLVFVADAYYLNKKHFDL